MEDNNKKRKGLKVVLGAIGVIAAYFIFFLAYKAIVKKDPYMVIHMPDGSIQRMEEIDCDSYRSDTRQIITSISANNGLGDEDPGYLEVEIWPINSTHNTGIVKVSIGGSNFAFDPARSFCSQTEDVQLNLTKMDILHFYSRGSFFQVFKNDCHSGDFYQKDVDYTISAEWICKVN